MSSLIVPARSARHRGVALAATLLTALASPALAHDGPIAGVDIRTRGNHVLLVASFGLVQSKGAGQPWTWQCEAAYGTGAVFEHEFEPSKKSDAIFVTAVDGLLVSRDGCSYAPAGLGSRFIATFTIAPNGDIYAAATDPEGSRVYRSTNDGMTFPQVSNAFRNYDTWRSIKLAPSDPNRIYLSGFRVPAANPVRNFIVYRSNDGGRTFTEAATTGVTGLGDTSVLLIAGVSPTNPDIVYARATAVGGGTAEDLYRSTDAGMTWTKILSRTEPIALLVRRNGHLLAGTATAGTAISTDGGTTFNALANAPGLSCLYESAEGLLYGCATTASATDPAIVTSSDGAAWTPVTRYSDISGPAECAAGTQQIDYCIPVEWCPLKEELQLTSTAVDCGEEGPEAGGCCDANASSSSAGLAALLGGLLLLVLGRARRPARR